MPYAFTIYPSRRLVYCRGWGDFALTQLLSLRRELADNPQFDPTYAIVIDVEEINLTRLTSGMIATLANANTFAPTARRAFVAAEPAHFGVARMFQIQRELSGTVADILVCRTLSEALTWLEITDFTPPSPMTT